MPIYTKKGDRGETGLPGGRRKPKTDQLFEVLGTLDETSATIGLAVSQIINKQLTSTTLLLESIQSDLLGIGTCIASEKPEESSILKKLKNKTAEFEEIIDQWEKEIGELKNFIIVGGCPAGASLHLARAVARKAEREFSKLPSNKPQEISIYLNRLSDLLFQSARFINNKSKTIETNWVSS